MIEANMKLGKANRPNSKNLEPPSPKARMSDVDEVQDTFAILDTELNELRETLEVAYATKDLALQNQVMRGVDQIGEILADLKRLERY